ncbi:hypothetical protein Tco_0363760 [Tanacetum coccineum]
MSTLLVGVRTIFGVEHTRLDTIGGCRQVADKDSGSRTLTQTLIYQMHAEIYVTGSGCVRTMMSHEVPTDDSVEGAMSLERIWTRFSTRQLDSVDSGG